MNDLRLQWIKRHNEALCAPRGDNEAAIVHFMHGFSELEAFYRNHYHTAIGDDGFIGPAYADMLKGFRALLNMELGRLDGGKLDEFVLNVAAQAKIDIE